MDHLFSIVSTGAGDIYVVPGDGSPDALTHPAATPELVWGAADGMIRHDEFGRRVGEAVASLSQLLG